ncbi:MAG: hypothetical protein LBU27_02850 [Candidatus Peribacteria bacterium]|jgi:hypothetical protein|nr:hypothetical protein [Candidatus Peribacteria bacterium]
MTDFHFSEVQVKVDNLCVILHNIARRQADGNFDYEALEKVRPKIAVQKWNGRLRRYETHFITTVDPMQSPSPEHPYHIEVPY